ncbi:MAG: hypothetical protein KKG13_03550 [Nanoarchaeota archaeon]|nr:hypothetical protein [Nanoarchaeota archaeon]
MSEKSNNVRSCYSCDQFFFLSDEFLENLDIEYCSGGRSGKYGHRWLGDCPLLCPTCTNYVINENLFKKGESKPYSIFSLKKENSLFTEDEIKNAVEDVFKNNGITIQKKSK